jgi:hypothetical protein
VAIPVLLILAVLWAAVLVPPVLRSRSESRRGMVGDFTSRLGVLTGQDPPPRSMGGRPPRTLRAVPANGARPVHGSSRPVASGDPAPMTSAQKRRRDVLIILGIAAIATVPLALVVDSLVLWGAHVAADLLLVAYVVLLVRLNQRRARTNFQRSIDSWPTPRP